MMAKVVDRPGFEPGASANLVHPNCWG